VPDRAVHPDREELAEFQASPARGPVASAGSAADAARQRRQEIEAHVAGCDDCRAVVDALAEVARRLAALPEPEPSPGFSLRLAAAVEREVEQLAAPRPRFASRATTWLAAAAVLLLVLGLVGVVGVLGRGSPKTATALRENRSTAPAGGAAAAAPAQAGLPVFIRSGDYSAQRLARDLSTDPAMRAAASGQAARGQTAKRGDGGARPDTGTAPRLQAPSSELSLSRSLSPAQQAACLARLQPAAGGEPQRVAFFIRASYRGQPATLAVTVVGSPPQRARMWVFAGAGCDQAPIAFEQATVGAP
jgi:hypothetical protein